MGIIAGLVLLVVTVAVVIGAMMWRKKHLGGKGGCYSQAEESSDSARVPVCLSELLKCEAAASWGTE